MLVARQAFVLHGYGATSINAIAKSARVSKTTLYARFSSKGALFREIVAQQIAKANEELLPSSPQVDPSLEDRLRAYIGVTLRRSLSKDVLEINRLIMGESHQFPELGEAARARFLVGVGKIAEIIEQCAQRDAIPCQDAAAAAELLLSCAFGWYTSVMLANRVVSDKERTSWINHVIRIFTASRSCW